MWDAAQYLRFGGERARPFFDLLAQVGAESPRYVADLGCGPGNLTAILARRWPRARVVGVDSSPEMVTIFPFRRVFTVLHRHTGFHDHG